MANVLSRVFLSCNCLTVPPPQGRDCPLSSCALYTVFYTVKGIPQGGAEPPWLGALSVFTEWMDAWPLDSAIHILCHTPVVCTVCLSFVFLIYGMCQICLSLDRVEVQNSVEQITARPAVTENQSHGEASGSFLVVDYWPRIPDAIPVGWETAGFQRQLTKLALYIPGRQVVLWMSSNSTGQSSSPQNTHSQLEKFATWRQQCLVIHIFMTIFSQRHTHVILSTALTNLGFTSALQVKLRKLVLISLIWLNHGLWAPQIALCSRSKKMVHFTVIGSPQEFIYFRFKWGSRSLAERGQMVVSNLAYFTGRPIQALFSKQISFLIPAVTVPGGLITNSRHAGIKESCAPSPAGDRKGDAHF